MQTQIAPKGMPLAYSMEYQNLVNLTCHLNISRLQPFLHIYEVKELIKYNY